MTKTRKSILFAIAAFLILLSAIWLNGFLEVDSCLDQGGKRDYEEKVCINADS